MIGRIERVELHEVVLPLRRPHVTATGVLDERRVILVAVTAGGVTGWGETGPVPGYSAATLDTCWDALVRAAHQMIAALGATVPPSFPDSCEVGLLQALDDVAARTAGVPLWRHFDGHRNRVVAGAVVGVAPLDEVVATVAARVDGGFRHVKVKIAPGHDVAPLRALDRHFPGLSLGADGNGSYPPGHRNGLRQLDLLTIAYLEQPFPAADLDGHVALAGEMTTPICLDESTKEPGWLAAARRPLSGLAATIKPARMSRGSLDRLLADPDMGSRIRLRVGGMLETGVGRAHAFAAASRDVFTLPTDLSPPAAYLDADVVDWEWPFVAGEVHLPTAPGIGVEIDRSRVAAVTVRSISIP